MATLTFLGATGTVTGSKYLLEAGGERLMIDCGLFQGEKELRLRNWNPLPIPPSSIQWLVLTHAHLDHTGYIPRLVKDGFRGQIYASPATVDLSKLVLPDSGHLQEEDAAYANKKGFSKHDPALPLYTYDEAVKSLESFSAIDESKPLELSSHFTLRCFSAGHILGARMIEVTVRENGSVKRILFSGDLGRFPQLILREPVVPEDGFDYMLLESTYGDRLHPRDDVGARLASIVEGTAQRWRHRGDSFVCGGPDAGTALPFPRAHRCGKMHSLPIHVDSPMAIDVTDLYRRHEEDHDLQTERWKRRASNPSLRPTCTLTKAWKTPSSLNDAHLSDGHHLGERHGYRRARRSSPGTLPPGPSQHHPLCGFSGGGYARQAIQSGAQPVKMYGHDVHMRARIETIENLSAHADYGEILAWLKRFSKAPGRTFMVHGEPRASEALRQRIAQELHWDVTVPTYLQTVTL